MQIPGTHITFLIGPFWEESTLLEPLPRFETNELRQTTLFFA
jgi:hypothetical protein